MILLAESRLSNEFILKFDVAKGCVLFLFSLLYKDSHIHIEAQKHMCVSIMVWTFFVFGIVLHVHPSLES